METWAAGQGSPRTRASYRHQGGRLLDRLLAANDAARDPQREIGCAIVAHALGDHAAGVGGVMTGERAREMDRKRCETRHATEPEIRSVSATAGPLAADISRNIFPDRQRQFGAGP